jgi:3-oxoacyl-[acyl-carrier protein] reductase
MLDGVIANMVVAVELTQKVIDPMTARKFGRIVNITWAPVKMLPLVSTCPPVRAQV